ncbi:MAG: aldehyde dehydrogenase family protein [Bergeyella zoohelcum]|nr:aldehyde dehydrogenase family protein [Bergeyella zoohelcum]
MNKTEQLNETQNAFLQWRKTSFAERQQLIKNLSEILLDRKEDWATIITKEMNKPISQAIAEIEKSAGMCRYYAEIPNVLATETTELGKILYQPLGIILGIMPWNFPFWQALRFAVPTLLAGNGVVMKHASICMQSGDAIQQIFEEAGFPKGIFNHLKINHQEVEELIANPLVQGVSLTGSELAGRKIAEIAGRNLKKSVLELGGSDAFIVLDDADLQQAARDAALARLQNCGQTCVAGKRFIIHSKIYDEFLKLFVAEYQSYTAGNPMDKATKLGGMARKDLADELQNQYEKALENGAEIIVPLVRTGDITFQQGLILMNENNPILQEELFGPLGMILVAKDDDDALKMANETPFGLANAVYTQNDERAMFFAENLESGGVAINQVFRSDAQMPFSGVKNSGFGTELSQYALFEFVVRKSVMM